MPVVLFDRCLLKLQTPRQPNLTSSVISQQKPRKLPRNFLISQEDICSSSSERGTWASLKSCCLGKTALQEEIRSWDWTICSLESDRVGLSSEHGQRITEVRHGEGGIPGNSLGGTLGIRAYHFPSELAERWKECEHLWWNEMCSYTRNRNLQSWPCNINTHSLKLVSLW